MALGSRGRWIGVGAALFALGGLALGPGCGSDGGGGSAADVEADGEVAEDSTGSDDLGPDAEAEGGGDGQGGGDATQDVGPGGATPLPATEAAEACEVACARLEADCPDSAYAEGCQAACEALVQQDGAWLGSYACAAQCVEVDCFPEEPFAVPASCEDMCPGVVACGLTEALLGTATPEQCDWLCAGSVAAHADALVVIACLAEKLDEGCDMEALAACLDDGPPEDPTEPPVEVDPWCEVACSGYAIDSGCGPQSALKQAWPTEAVCMANCPAATEQVDAGPAIFAGCMAAVGCGAPTPCLTAPFEPVEPFCEGACSAIDGVCGGEGGYTQGDRCPELCSGALAVVGDPVASALQCLADLDGCPGEAPDGAFDALALEAPVDAIVGCALSGAGPPEVCGACAALDACFLQVSGGLPPGWDCLALCATMTAADPTGFDEVAECVAGWAGSCEQVITCASGGSAPGPPGLCQSACAKLEGACGDAGGGDCVGACAAEIDASVSALGAWICRLFTPCDQVASKCAVPPAVAPECESACEASDWVCGAWEGGCVAACSGVLSTLGQSGPDAALCAVGQLGPTCDPSGVGACL